MLNHLTESTKVYRGAWNIKTALIAGAIGNAVLIGQITEARHLDGVMLGLSFIVLYTFFCLRIARSAIVEIEGGVKVINLFSSVVLRWIDIDRFDVGRSGLLPLVCRIHMKDGAIHHAFAIQERTNFPSGAAERITDTLNKELVAHVSRMHCAQQIQLHHQ